MLSPIKQLEDQQRKLKALSKTLADIHINITKVIGALNTDYEDKPLPVENFPLLHKAIYGMFIVNKWFDPVPENIVFREIGERSLKYIDLVQSKVAPVEHLMGTITAEEFNDFMVRDTTKIDRYCKQYGEVYQTFADILQSFEDGVLEL